MKIAFFLFKKKLRQRSLLRWSANFTPELEKQGCKVNYSVDEFGKDTTTVEVKDGNETIEKP